MKICLITGSNRGLGYAITEELLKTKDTIIVSCAKRNLPSRRNNMVKEIILDVSNAKNIQIALSDVYKEFGKIDILINNAGVYIDKTVDIFDINKDIINETLDVNFYGPLLMIQKILPNMMENNYGRIVNVSSILSQFSTMGRNKLAYRFSKVGLNLLTKNFYEHIKGLNLDIRINSVGLEILQVSVISLRTYIRINGTNRNANGADSYQMWNDNKQSLTEVYGGSSGVYVYKNRNLIQLTNSTSLPSLNYNGVYSLGRYNATLNNMNGYIQELLISTKDQIMHRSIISNDIDKYYSINTRV